MKDFNISSSVENYIRNIDMFRESTIDSTVYIPTGFEDLDLGLNGGLQKQNLYILKGRKGIGKTCLASNIVFNLSLNGYKTMFCTIQTDTGTITQKMLSNVSGVPYRKVKSGLLTEQEYDFLTCAGSTLATRNISLLSNKNKLEDIITEACELKTDSGLDAIIIDSLELIKVDHKKARTILNTLKNVAKQIDVSILVVSDDSSIDESTMLTDIDYLLYYQCHKLDGLIPKASYNVTVYVLNKTVNRPENVLLRYTPGLQRFY